MKKRGVIGGMALLLMLLCLLTPFGGTVSAMDPRGVYHVDTAEKKIALTFDDGPHPRYTDAILKILAENDIKATFFEIGVNIKQYSNTTRHVIAAGHEIGNHTYTHTTMKHLSGQELKEEIAQTDRLLKELGYGPVALFRPPQGICTDVLFDVMSSTGKRAILWNIDTLDWAHRSSDEIVREIEKYVSGGDIILFHDYISGENTTIPAIKKLIPALKARGYQFVTVSELMQNG